MQSLLLAGDGRYAWRVRPPALPDADDAALARKITAAGPDRDTAAESEFCRRFAPRIRLYGLRHLRSDAAAADLTQDVLLMVLQKLRAGAVHEPDRIASFVLGSCRQTIVDGRRNQSRRERLLETFAADLPASHAGYDEPTHEARVPECLSRLPDRERTVLVMTFFDDLPAEAVGRELGISAGNVRVIRHRGLARLRTCLDLADKP
jgi:RNA polymerase sigma-70 factor (ECF subfamily)